MSGLLSFIAEYWVQTICVAVTGVIAGFWAKAKKTYKKGKQVENEEKMKPYKDWTEECVNDESNELVKMFQQETNKLQDRYIADHEKLENKFNDQRNEIIDTFTQERNEVMKEISDEKLVAAEDRQKILAALNNLSEQVSKIDNQSTSTQKAVLYWYKKDFLEACEELLASGHVITFDELQEIRIEHDIYKGLGGNHEGDSNFALVEEKYKAYASK